MITKDIFYCEKEHHLFEWYPWDLPSQDHMDNCTYCKNPLTYLGPIEWDEERGIWIAKFSKLLEVPHFSVGTTYDARSGVCVKVFMPSKFTIQKYDYEVDYQTGERV